MRRTSGSGGTIRRAWDLNRYRNHQNPFIMKKILLFVFLLAGTALAAQKSQPIRVLFIGNSYTFYHNLPRSGVANRRKRRLSDRRDGLHQGQPTLYRSPAKRETASDARRRRMGLRRPTGAERAPALPTELVAEGTYRPARTLDSLVHAGSPQARVIYYMTWGRKEGSKTYGNHYPPVATYEGMQQRLATSYLEMAYRSGGWCAPVGLAWMRVRSEKPEYELYMPDGSHPSEAGTLLAANVIFSVIYGKPYASRSGRAFRSSRRNTCDKWRSRPYSTTCG